MGENGIVWILIAILVVAAGLWAAAFWPEKKESDTKQQELEAARSRHAQERASIKQELDLDRQRQHFWLSERRAMEERKRARRVERLRLGN